MGLPGRQQRALHGIESALEARDPRLTAMFAMFTRLTRGEPLGMEGLSRLRKAGAGARWQYGLLPLLPVAAIMALLAGLLIAMSMGSLSACATTTTTPRFAPGSRFALSCQARPSSSPGLTAPGGYNIFPRVP